MDDDDRGSAGRSDRAIRLSQPGVGATGQRALRPVANAISAFNAKPTPSQDARAGVPFARLTLASANWVTGGSGIRFRVGVPRAAGVKTPPTPPSDPTGGSIPTPWLKALPPEGPPWLCGYVLYDGATEQLDDLFRSNLFELDAQTSDKVLLTYIGNPTEVGPVYDAMRDAGLRKSDEEDARAFLDEQKRGWGADFIRRREVHKLIKLTGIERNKLPCIAFFPYPFCAPPTVLKIRPEWIFSPSARRNFSDALIDFFKTTDLEGLVHACKTNVELARRFEHLIAEQMESRLSAELAEENPKDTCIFQKQGKTWFVAYDGVRMSIGDSRGMTYIRHLICRPGQETLAIILRGVGAPEGMTPIVGSAGEVLDGQALKEYREHLKDLEQDIREAEANNDVGTAERLKEEFEAFTAEIGRATGLGGRNRRAADDRERARQAVSVAIHRALNAIKKDHEPLWQHLDNSLKIGEFLSYQPDQPTSWTT